MTSATRHTYCHSVGKVLVLQNEYSPDQLWFDFVDAVFLDKVPEKAPAKTKTPKNSSKELLQWRMPERDIPQLSFCFSTATKASKGFARQLSRAGYPSFQRTPEGNLLILEPKRDYRIHEPRAKMIEWCNSNMRGLYVAQQSKFIFEVEDDYILALLDGRFFKKPRGK